MDALLIAGWASLKKEASIHTKACKRKRDREQAKVTQAWTETARLLTVVCILTEARRHPMAVAWDVQRARWCSLWGQVEVEDEDLRRHIITQLELDAWTSEESEFLFHPTSTAQVALWFRAWTLVVEWRLAVDTIHTNTEKHMAIPARHLHDQAGRLMLDPAAELSEGVRALAHAWFHQRTQNAKDIWLCKWRKRWGFTVRALPSRSIMLETELRTRVLKRTIETCPFLASLGEAQNGPAQR